MKEEYYSKKIEMSKELTGETFLRMLCIIVFWLLANSGELANAQIPQDLPGWPLIYHQGPVPTNAIPIPIMGDDLESSVLFFGTNIPHQIEKLHFDATSWPGWPFQADTSQFLGGDLRIEVDIDNDDMIETVAIAKNGLLSGFLYIIDDNGIVIPGFPKNIDNPASLNVADFNGDDQYEIMTFSVTDGYIYSFDRFGHNSEGWPISVPEDINYNRSAAVGDIDQNGTDELVFQGDKHIYAFSYDGAQPTGFPINIFDTSFSFYNAGWPPALGDINGDGSLEIIASGDNWHSGIPYFTSFAAVYSSSGEMTSGWPYIIQNEMVTTGLVLGDIDNDSQAEIGFGYGSHVLFLDGTGNPLPGWPIELTPIEPDMMPWWPQSDLIIVDINGDGYGEIFPDFNLTYADGHSWAIAWDHLGQFLPGYPLRIQGSTAFHPPSFCYDRQLNKLDMGQVRRYVVDFPEPVDSLFLGVLQFPDSSGPPNLWPMRSHDNLQSRNYSFVDRVTSIKDVQSEISPKRCVLMQNFPNPFNAQTSISYSLAKEGPVKLAIYNLLGQKVATILDGIQIAGEHDVLWDARKFTSGVYFARLDSEDQSKNIKMVLLK